MQTFTPSSANNRSKSIRPRIYKGRPLHIVRGHFRRKPNGGLTFIRPYYRTNPDGIERNNLSWRK